MMEMKNNSKELGSVFDAILNTQTESSKMVLRYRKVADFNPYYGEDVA